MEIREDVVQFKLHIEGRVKRIVAMARAAYPKEDQETALSTQQKAVSQLDDLILSANRKLESLSEDPTNLPSLIYLSSQIPEWIKAYERLSITDYRHEKVYAAATDEINAINNRWRYFCSRREVSRYIALQGQISEIEKLTEKLEAKAKRLSLDFREKDEKLRDYKENYAAHEDKIFEEIELELTGIDVEMKHIREDIDSLKDMEAECLQKIKAAGFFSFIKKGRLKKTIREGVVKQASLTGRIAVLETRKDDIRRSYAGKIKQLQEDIRILEEQHSEVKQQLLLNQTALTNRSKELKEQKEELEAIRFS